MSDQVDRAVKGGRAAFFDDPDVDRLLAMLMRLTTEHWALKERVLRLERMLAETGTVSADMQDTWEPDDATSAAWDQDSFALVQAIVEAGRNIKRS